MNEIGNEKDNKTQGESWLVSVERVARREYPDLGSRSYFKGHRRFTSCVIAAALIVMAELFRPVGAWAAAKRTTMGVVVREW